MKYLLVQIFIAVFSVIFLLFLLGLEGFLPLKEDKSLDWYNITSVLFFLFIFIQSLISVLIFLIQKFLVCGFKEFPSIGFSFKWGVTSSVLAVFIILFNIFHIVNFGWGILLFAFIIAILVLLKF